MKGLQISKMQEQYRIEREAWEQESSQLRDTIKDLQNKIQHLEGLSDSTLQQSQGQTSFADELTDMIKERHEAILIKMDVEMEALKEEKNDLLRLLKEEQNRYMEIYNEMEAKESKLRVEVNDLNEAKRKLEEENRDLQNLKQIIAMMD